MGIHRTAKCCRRIHSNIVANDESVISIKNNTLRMRHRKSVLMDERTKDLWTLLLTLAQDRGVILHATCCDDVRHEVRKLAEKHNLPGNLGQLNITQTTADVSPFQKPFQNARSGMGISKH